MTDNTQASEDTLTYGVDQGTPGGDYTALSIKKGSTLYTFVGDEAVAIIDVIRTEKLKLLAEVRGRVVGDNEDTQKWEDPIDRQVADECNQLRAEMRTILTKLEAEL